MQELDGRRSHASQLNGEVEWLRGDPPNPYLGFIHILASLLAAIRRGVAQPGDPFAPAELEDEVLAVDEVDVTRDGRHQAVGGGALMKESGGRVGEVEACGIRPLVEGALYNLRIL